MWNLAASAVHEPARSHRLMTPARWFFLALMIAANAAIHLASIHAAPYLDEGDFASSGLWLSRGDLFYAAPALTSGAVDNRIISAL